MGTELALRLIDPGHHELVVWNRTPERAQRVKEAGAAVADTPEWAIEGADLVISCLFGPAAVADVITGHAVLPAGSIWADVTTISPQDARVQAQWAADHGVRFVHSPVVGTLGPARAGKLGVYVGSTDANARQLVGGVVAAYADPDRLQLMESASEAATAKLLANLALAVTAQGVAEAIRLGMSEGLEARRVLDLLGSTSLGWMAAFKRDFTLGADTSDAQFSTDAISKDVRLMLHTSDEPLPATTAALESLIRAQREGYGAHDFSIILQEEARGR